MLRARVSEGRGFKLEAGDSLCARTCPVVVKSAGSFVMETVFDNVGTPSAATAVCIALLALSSLNTRLVEEHGFFVSC